MPYTSLDILPGIDLEKTMLLNQGGWSLGSGIRFFNGMVQKKGGYQQIVGTPLVGTGRGMHAWADTTGFPYLVVGTEQRLQLYTGSINDITPIRLVRNAFAPTNFAVVLNSNVVTITDAGHGLSVGDWVQLVVPVSVGGAGVALYLPAGFYQVQTVPASNTYTILGPTNAGATSSAGAVPAFTSSTGSPNISVNINSHGYAAGQTFAVQVSTTVGGVVIAPATYSITSITDANNFIIVPNGNAGSNATVSENGGNTILNYLIPTGRATAGTSSSFGYGMGNYGVGNYGVAGTFVLPIRQWFLDNFGQFMIGNYTGSPIYVYRPGTDTVAIPVDVAHFPSATQPPTQVNVSFMSTQQQMLIALGCDTPGGGGFNPLLVRWCDLGDFTAWQALSTNQAGSYAIPSGSRLVGGISAVTYNVICTDIDMWIMNYLGGTGSASLVWAFNRLAGSRGLLAAHAIALLSNVIYYPSPNGFFQFNGASVRPIKCTVWDFFWQNLNKLQVDKVNVQVNSQFQEITWCFPSATGNGECDSSITFCAAEGVWYYEPAANWARTCWIDQNVFGAPMGVDLAAIIQQAEQGNDANGQPLSVSAQTGWFAVSDGTLAMMLERLEADLRITGGNQRVFLTVYAQDYANDPNMRTYGPYQFVLGAGPIYSIVRARGRFMSLKVSSNDLGVFWRLGRMRYMIKKAGSRAT